ncbi:MAG: hypothetical protein KDA21_00620 [Phycisphaerales bacterium]|nr:hypothetical protein [Phycisphaerales bacterium]
MTLSATNGLQLNIRTHDLRSAGLRAWRDAGVMSGDAGDFGRSSAEER